MAVAFLLFLFVVSEGSFSDGPPQPKFSETYKAWIFQTIYAYNTTIEANGYTVRDQAGGREIQNVTIRYENGTLLEQYSQLHRMDINTTFLTTWDIKGNVTCVKSVGLMTPSIWDWVPYTNYTGRNYFFNVDEWFYYGSRLNRTYVDDLSLSVSMEDPNVPLIVYDHTYAMRSVFYSFDPSYKPADSDFQPPTSCNDNYGGNKQVSPILELIQSKRKQRLFFL